MNKLINVVVCGASGKMGKQTIETIKCRQDMHLAGSVDIKDEDTGNLIISKRLEDIISHTDVDVMVDFTNGSSAPQNILTCVLNNIACVVGTTGIIDEDLKTIQQKAEKNSTPVLIAPNFSIGAVLMMKFAKEAAKYFDWSEIIELHHENKLDAPSGTALRTAQIMSQEKEILKNPFKIASQSDAKSRGGLHHGIHIHSVRMPGLLAHQEIILGASGETLRIRHDSLSRDCFMPGVMMAIRKVRDLKGLVIGLENILL